ncbi:VanZ family protein [Naasia sp. SYSU D00057]|uniref:VanZ family protein n=1 Tax=Naasia sp. SYSU D00057 TaxID=2817380 RepID=UPI001B3064FF|nr:VanZ family protein [Naasia sp. SYSU D00057]
MITDVLLANPWLTPTALVVVVVLGPVVGVWLVGRPRLALGLAALSLLPVAALTLVPVQRELYEFCAVQWSLPTPGRVELFANVVLFVVPVLLAGVGTRRPLLVLAAASGLSALLEAFQAVVPGIGRSCDTNDWLCNTIGASIGAVLALAALAIVRRRDGRAAGSAQQGNPDVQTAGHR